MFIVFRLILLQLGDPVFSELDYHLISSTLLLIRLDRVVELLDNLLVLILLLLKLPLAPGKILEIRSQETFKEDDSFLKEVAFLLGCFVVFKLVTRTSINIFHLLLHLALHITELTLGGVLRSLG